MLSVGIVKTWCIGTGLNIATGIIAQLPTLLNVHWPMQISVSVHSAIAFVIVKTSLRHWLQIPNLFKAPLPTVVCFE
jgi:hypothetical protein